MRITKEIAEKNVGRYYDKYNRFASLNGAYPRQIIRFSDGTLGYKRMGDGICSPFDFVGNISDEYADYFFDDIEECK